MGVKSKKEKQEENEWIVAAVKKIKLTSLSKWRYNNMMQSINIQVAFFAR